MIHFAKDHATPTRTDTLVSVVSIMSTRTNPVQNVVFQAAAPKVSNYIVQNTHLFFYNCVLCWFSCNCAVQKYQVRMFESVRITLPGFI